MTNKFTDVKDIQKDILDIKNNLVNNTIKTKWDREIALNKLYKGIEKLQELKK